MITSAKDLNQGRCPSTSKASVSNFHIYIYRPNNSKLNIEQPLRSHLTTKKAISSLFLVSVTVTFMHFPQKYHESPPCTGHLLLCLIDNMAKEHKL